MITDTRAAAFNAGSDARIAGRSHHTNPYPDGHEH
jgi:ribosome modulation factor